jgi:predicted ATPase
MKANLISTARRKKSAMIESIEIQNFRCFRKLKLDGLGKINIVVGGNSSGKTSLLEAIFFSQMTNPEIVQRLRLWRGLGQSPEATMNRAGYESFWRDLFHGLSNNAAIDIRATGTIENTRHVRVFYKPSESVSIKVGES